jgi:hypothetical protein
MTATPRPGRDPHGPYGAMTVTAAPPPAGPLGIAAARAARRRRGSLAQRAARPAAVAIGTAAALYVTAVRVGSLDAATAPAIGVELATVVEPTTTTTELPPAPAAPTVEPTATIPGCGTWTLVWALTPDDPAAEAGLWPGTPWPGRPGRAVLGVACNLEAVPVGSTVTVDGAAWTVHRTLTVTPDQWETVVEQPVEAAEVAIYETVDTPGRGRVMLLARGGATR